MNLNLDHSKKYLLACSFGPDSMALFSLLMNGKYSFSVAHVNYGLRVEAAKETRDLKAFCEAHNVQLFVHQVTEKINSNIEEKCRQIRYDFFASLFAKCHFDYLLVAHNQDDNLETYLLQKKRKNLVNYYGICDNAKAFGMNVLRPLLSVKKIDLTNYCLENNIPFAVDCSNLSNRFERNIIRHEIIESMSDQEREMLLEEIKAKNAELTFLKGKVEGEQAKGCDFLKTLSDRELAYALTYLARLVKTDGELSLKCVKEIKKILESSKPNIEMRVNELVFVKSYDQCRFRLSLPSNDYSFILNSPSVLETDYFFADFRGDVSNRHIQASDFPLTIRNAQKNDEIAIKGYSVSLRRLFIDWKMPVELRKRWPVILNKEGKLLYVPRYQSNFAVTKNINFYVK